MKDKITNLSINEIIYDRILHPWIAEINFEEGKQLMEWEAKKNNYVTNDFYYIEVETNTTEKFYNNFLGTGPKTRNTITFQQAPRQEDARKTRMNRYWNNQQFESHRNK